MCEITRVRRSAVCSGDAQGLCRADQGFLFYYELDHHENGFHLVVLIDHSAGRFQGRGKSESDRGHAGVCFVIRVSAQDAGSEWQRRLWHNKKRQ